jgi:hypothetical protein
MSSKTTTKVRPGLHLARRVRGDPGPLGGDHGGGGGTWMASKLAMACVSPSSVRTKASRPRPVIGAPFLSVTTTSTVTCSTCAGKDGLSAGRGRASGAEAGLAAGSARALGGSGEAGGALGLGGRGRGEGERKNCDGQYDDGRCLHIALGCHTTGQKSTGRESPPSRPREGCPLTAAAPWDLMGPVTLRIRAAPF